MTTHESDERRPYRNLAKPCQKSDQPVQVTEVAVTTAAHGPLLFSGSSVTSVVVTPHG